MIVLPNDGTTTPMNDAVTPARPLLFTPMTIRGITLPNRTVVAPMVQYRSRDGIPGDFHFVHLGKFAKWKSPRPNETRGVVLLNGDLSHDRE